MIVCVTLNPCLDKTLTVGTWQPGDNVRGISIREVVGGKGNNVARALRRLGQSARPLTWLGGAVGAHCAELLRAEGLEPLVVPSQASTRVILTVRTGDGADQTAFFDPDPAITREEADSLHATVAEILAARQTRLLCLSGSSPSEATHSLYSDLIGLARSHRVPVFLDSYGPALEAIWGFWPDVLQLNRREAAAHVGVPLAEFGDDQTLALLDRWGRRGVQVGVITDGPGDVLAAAGDHFYRLTPPAITAVNPIGSGDCCLAGLAAGWLSGLAGADLLRRGVACAVSNALTWDAGAICVADLPGLEAQVAVHEQARPTPATSGSSLVRRTFTRRR